MPLSLNLKDVILRVELMREVYERIRDAIRLCVEDMTACGEILHPKIIKSILTDAGLTSDDLN